MSMHLSERNISTNSVKRIHKILLYKIFFFQWYFEQCKAIYKQRAKNEIIMKWLIIQQGTYYRNHEILPTDDNVITLEFYIDVEVTNPFKSWRSS